MKICPDCRNEYAGVERFCPIDGTKLDELMATADDKYVGTTLSDRYEMLARVGDGPSGLTYRARHNLLGTIFCIKVLPPDVAANEDAVVRFREAAAKSARLEEEHIVSIHDFGRLEDGGRYLVTDYVEGSSLAAAIIDGGAMTPGRSMAVGMQVAMALERSHLSGLLHLAVKPNNVLLTVRKGEPDFVKLTDFGVSELYPAGALTRLDDNSRWLSAAEYLSPEQVLGEPTSERTDVYALGAVVYEMLTGRPPFVSGSASATMKRLIYEKPLPLHLNKSASAVPPEVEAVVMRALSKSPSGRFRNMADLRMALEQVGGSLLTQTAMPAFDQEEESAEDVAEATTTADEAPAAEISEEAPPPGPAEPPVGDGETVLQMPRLDLEQQPRVHIAVDLDAEPGLDTSPNDAVAAEQAAAPEPAVAAQPKGTVPAEGARGLRARLAKLKSSVDAPASDAPASDADVDAGWVAAEGEARSRERSRYAWEMPAVSDQRETQAVPSLVGGEAEAPGEGGEPPGDRGAGQGEPAKADEIDAAEAAAKAEAAEEEKAAEEAKAAEELKAAEEEKKAASEATKTAKKAAKKGGKRASKKASRKAAKKAEVDASVAKAGPPGDRGAGEGRAAEPASKEADAAPPAEKADADAAAAASAVQLGVAEVPARLTRTGDDWFVESMIDMPRPDLTDAYHEETHFVRRHLTTIITVAVVGLPVLGFLFYLQGEANRPVAATEGSAGGAAVEAATASVLNKGGMGTLLQKAELALDHGRLVRPEAGSVLTYIGEIRAVDPTSSFASELEGRAVRKLIVQGRKASRGKRWAEARTAFEDLRRFRPGDTAAAEQLAKIAVHLAPSTAPAAHTPPAVEPAPPGASLAVAAATPPPAVEPPKPPPVEAPPPPAAVKPAPKPTPAPAKAQPKPRAAPTRARVATAKPTSRRAAKPAAPAKSKRKSKPKSKEASRMVQLGRVHLRNARFKEAMEAFTEAARSNSRSAEAYAGLGDVSFQMGRFSDAVRHQKRAIRLNGRHSRYHANLGNAYYKLREYNRAIEHWKKALVLDPKNSLARSYIKIAEQKLSQQR